MALWPEDSGSKRRGLCEDHGMHTGQWVFSLLRAALLRTVYLAFKGEVVRQQTASLGFCWAMMQNIHGRVLATIDTPRCMCA